MKVTFVTNVPEGKYFIFAHDLESKYNRKLKVKSVTSCATTIDGEKFVKDYGEETGKWVRLGENYCIANTSEVIIL